MKKLALLALTAVLVLVAPAAADHERPHKPDPAKLTEREARAGARSLAEKIAESRHAPVTVGACTKINDRHRDCRLTWGEGCSTTAHTRLYLRDAKGRRHRHTHTTARVTRC